MTLFPPIWKHVPTGITTIYTFECAVCHAKGATRFEGQSLMYPEPPAPGWRELSPGVWICPAHELTITVDGKDFQQHP